MQLRQIIPGLLSTRGRDAGLALLGSVLPPASEGVGAFWVASDGSVRLGWPRAGELPAALQTADAECPVLRPLEDGREALVLPLGTSGEAVVLVAPRGALTAGAADLELLVAALERVAAHDDEVRALSAERDEMRQRAEESEALHVLGLGANRSLDPDEVLALVARFTRTLLGAQYVVVSTLEDGRIHRMTGVGLRSEEPGEEDALSRAVVEAGKPIEVREGRSPAPADFPLHAREEMRSGLAVPLSLFGQTFGALIVGYRRHYEIGSRDLRLALALAGHGAVAISNARLHRALADRSGELEHAYEELRWSSQAKDRFFASMSHELRTPLNAILGYHSLLLDSVVGEVPAGIRPFLESAHRATQSLLHLVNDVLDLSKLAAGKMELVITPTSLGPVVREAVQTVEPLAAARGIPLVVILPPDLAPLPTDADRVRQVLVNLLSNAIKFSETGDIEIRVESRVRGSGAEPGGDVLVHVRDCGPGIAPADQERIFHEFEQVAGSTVRGGTGLGLPISRKLARLLGGDLLVASVPGQGSTFTLRLPLQGPPPDRGT